MRKISDVVEFVSGSPQFRIRESFEEQAPIYHFYSQTELLDDLVGIDSKKGGGKQVRTWDKLQLLKSGDVVFSLISGTASMVKSVHDNYLYTQNYVKLIPSDMVDAKYLVFLMNEDKLIKKQLTSGLQGSQVLKYTLRQVNNLEVSQLPTLKKQKCIGDIYFKQLRLQMLRKRVAEADTLIRLQKLKEVN